MGIPFLGVKPVAPVWGSLRPQGPEWEAAMATGLKSQLDKAPLVLRKSEAFSRIASLKAQWLPQANALLKHHGLYVELAVAPKMAFSVSGTKLRFVFKKIRRNSASSPKFALTREKRDASMRKPPPPSIPPPPTEPIPENEPPPPPSAVCYLLWQPDYHGSLWTHWSETPIEGALASFAAVLRPAGPVPRFKLTQNGGRSELGREVNGANPKKFFQAMCSYYKLAYSLNAPISLHAAPSGCNAVAIYLSDAASNITRVVAGGADAPAVDLINAVAVAAVAEQASDFEGVMSMETQVFVQMGAARGAAMLLKRSEQATTMPAPIHDHA